MLKKNYDFCFRQSLSFKSPSYHFSIVFNFSCVSQDSEKRYVSIFQFSYFFNSIFLCFIIFYQVFCYKKLFFWLGPLGPGPWAQCRGVAGGLPAPPLKRSDLAWSPFSLQEREETGVASTLLFAQTHDNTQTQTHDNNKHAQHTNTAQH